MRTTQPLTVTLPDDMADMVRAKVASGEYATENEVIRDGLRSLQDRDLAVEEWLREDVARSYDEHEANPGAAISAETMMDRLHALHQARVGKQNR